MERRVIDPVCQCSRSSGIEHERELPRRVLAGNHCAGTRWASPSAVLNRSSNSTTVPSLWCGSSIGYSLPYHQVVVGEAGVVRHQRHHLVEDLLGESSPVQPQPAVVLDDLQSISGITGRSNTFRLFHPPPGVA